MRVATPLGSPSLADVIAAYQRNLEASREARDYLQARGLYHPRILSRFSASFSSGDLVDKTSEAGRAALEEMGILKPGGKEHFAGCITLPLLDLQGEPASLYGRRIDKKREPRHLYMNGPHRGLLNPKAYKAYPDGIILRESILDALSLMVIGFQNIDALYGTGGLSKIHMEALGEAGTKEVVLALDNDDAGREGAFKVAERLKKKGIASRMIFPPCKDWNEYLVSEGGVEEKRPYMRSLIQNATLMQPSYSNLKFSSRNGRHMVSTSELSYQIIRLNEGFSSSFKVNIRASLAAPMKTTSLDSGPEGRKVIDNVDLYSARSRSFFANQLGASLEP